MACTFKLLALPTLTLMVQKDMGQEEHCLQRTSFVTQVGKVLAAVRASVLVLTVHRLKIVHFKKEVGPFLDDP